MFSHTGLLMQSAKPALEITPTSIKFPVFNGQEWRNIVAYALIKTDGTLFTFGGRQSDNPLNADVYLSEYQNSADIVHLFTTLNPAVAIYSSESSFSVLRADDVMITYGYDPELTTYVTGANGENPIDQVSSTSKSYAYLSNGSVYLNGDYTHGGEYIVFNFEIDNTNYDTYMIAQLGTNVDYLAALNNYIDTANAATDVYNAANGTSYPYMTTPDPIYKPEGIYIWYDTEEVRASRIPVQGFVTAKKADYADLTQAARDAETDTASYNIQDEIVGLTTNPVTAIYSNWYTYAAIRQDGTVVTWGRSEFGAEILAANLNWEGVDYSLAHTVALRDNSKVVVSIYATAYGFAALCSDGSVIGWGAEHTHGTNTDLSGKIPTEQLANLDGTIKVIDIATSRTAAFAAIREDGSVITWGERDAGGWGSRTISHQSNNFGTVAPKINGSTPTARVKKIYATANAFCALRYNGSLVPWGSPIKGGKFTPSNWDGVTGWTEEQVAALVNGTVRVVEVVATYECFAALREDGLVVTWGRFNKGRFNNETVRLSFNDPNNKVIRLYANNGCFAGIREDGSVVASGVVLEGGDITPVAHLLNGTIKAVSIHSCHFNFLALREDGTIVSWGGDSTRGVSPINAVVDTGGSVASVADIDDLKTAIVY